MIAETARRRYGAHTGRGPSNIGANPGHRPVHLRAFGIVDFSTVAPTTALSTVIFGRRSAGTVFGLVALSHQIGSALGSYAGGLVHDLTGSYAGFILAGAALSGAAAFMSWAISESPAPVREAVPA
jgi:predicted MFS family arabinose efflux permease